MIETGTTLQQRYKIDKQIGQGGMGAVYVATDERFGSVVAIKETLCMDDNFRKAIEREARLLNSLKHPALPRVSDHFEESNGQFLVMEYIPGDDVASILERDQRAFPVEQVLIWADQLLDALDYLHNQDIPVIHRDIKPQNLKITSRGQIILLDFGLAKGNPTDAGHHTAAKSIFGYSRNYASLEQIQGTGTDPRSDLYSLAATLYHLLTNSAPEDALTRAMSVLSQKDDPLMSANRLNADVSRGVAGVLHKALDLNASGRPASAAEMRQMLSESENYAYLVDEITLSAVETNAQVFAQATKLMPEETRSDEVKQTDIKTEVLPVFLSELTAVSSAGAGSTNAAPAHLTSVPAQKKRGVFAAASAFGVLLVGAAIAGGIYVAKPSVFGITPEAGDATTSLPLAAESNTASNSNTDPVQIGSGSSVTAGLDTPASAENRPADTVERPADTTGSTGKGKTTGAPRAQPEDEDFPSETVITTRDDRGTTTTVRRIPNNDDPHMTELKPAPIPPYMRGEPEMDRRPAGNNMTPEQRRRMQRVLRNNPQMRPIIIPPKP